VLAGTPTELEVFQRLVDATTPVVAPQQPKSGSTGAFPVSAPIVPEQQPDLTGGGLGAKLDPAHRAALDRWVKENAGTSPQARLAGALQNDFGFGPLTPEEKKYFAGSFGVALAIAASSDNTYAASKAKAQLGQELTAMSEAPGPEEFVWGVYYAAEGGAYADHVPVDRDPVGETVPSVAAKPMAAALAGVMYPNPKDAGARARETERLWKLMTWPDNGGKLFTPKSAGARRAVIDVLKAYPNMTAGSLMKAGASFWEAASPWLHRTVAEAAARPAAQAALDSQQRGGEAREYEGIYLDNMVGHFTGQNLVALVSGQIREAGREMGGDGRITRLPFQLATQDGPVPFMVYRVDREVGGKLQSQFVDSYVGGRYPDLAALLQKIPFPPGLVTGPKGGELAADGNGNVLLETQETQATRSIGYHVEQRADNVVSVVGSFAGLVALAGSGPPALAAGGIAGVAGLYKAGGYGAEVAGMASRNQPVLWGENVGQARFAEAMAVAHLLSAGGIGAKLLGPTARFTSGMPMANFFSAGAARGGFAAAFASEMPKIGMTASAVGGVATVYHAFQHRSEMTDKERVQAYASALLLGTAAVVNARGIAPGGLASPRGAPGGGRGTAGGPARLPGPPRDQPPVPAGQPVAGPPAPAGAAPVLAGGPGYGSPAGIPSRLLAASISAMATGKPEAATPPAPAGRPAGAGRRPGTRVEFAPDGLDGQDNWDDLKAGGGDTADGLEARPSIEDFIRDGRALGPNGADLYYRSPSGLVTDISREEVIKFTQKLGPLIFVRWRGGMKIFRNDDAGHAASGRWVPVARTRIKEAGNVELEDYEGLPSLFDLEHSLDRLRAIAPDVKFARKYNLEYFARRGENLAGAVVLGDNDRPAGYYDPVDLMVLSREARTPLIAVKSLFLGTKVIRIYPAPDAAENESAVLDAYREALAKLGLGSEPDLLQKIPSDDPSLLQEIWSYLPGDKEEAVIAQMAERLFPEYPPEERLQFAAAVAERYLSRPEEAAVRRLAFSGLMYESSWGWSGLTGRERDRIRAEVGSLPYLPPWDASGGGE
jgi:hypothetical protein